MKAGGGDWRQYLGGMMHLVELPKQGDLVLYIMGDEVTEVVADKEGDRTGHLDRYRAE